jgi:hypothetical protein
MGTKNQVLVLTLLTASAALTPILSQTVPSPLPHPRGYVCVRAAAPLTIDGRLDEDEWSRAPWTDDFVDIEGDVRPRPALRTRVKMLWDDEFLYIGADLAEPHLWATLTEHDSVIFRDNDFELFVDPNGDNHEYYEFEINALNTGWDLLLPIPYKDGGHAVDGWEIRGLKTAVHLDGTLNDASDVDRGWSVELAVPWKALGELARQPAPPHEGDQWRVNFSRVEWPVQIDGRAYRKVAGASEHNWVWSPQHVVDMHRPETWGYVQFERTARPFVPDASWPARRWLQSVYYAQREYQKVHGRYAVSLDELRMVLPAADGLTQARTGATLDRWQSCVSLGVGEWCIREDSKLWRRK